MLEVELNGVVAQAGYRELELGHTKAAVVHQREERVAVPKRREVVGCAAVVIYVKRERVAARGVRQSLRNRSGRAYGSHLESETAGIHVGGRVGDHIRKTK